MLTGRERLAKHWKRLAGKIRVRKSGAAKAGFIFGVQRSGTNMLIETFAACPYVEEFNENDEEAFENYRLRDFDTIRHLVQRSFANTVVFKPIADSQHALKCLNTFEGSRAVWAFRHYADVINSSLKNWREHREIFDYILNDRTKANWKAEKLSVETLELIRRFNAANLDNASSRGLFWCIRNEFFYSQGLDRDQRVRLVSYEQLVSNPHACLESVFDFLGAKYQRRYADKVHASSVKKNKAPDMLPEITDMCEAMWNRLSQSYTEQQSLTSMT